MADKKLNEVSQLTDFDYALVVKGNDVAKVTKQQLATILGELLPVATAENDGLISKNWFIYRGDINIESYKDITILDGLEKCGFYTIIPEIGAWGTLLIFYNGNGGRGGYVQILCTIDDITSNYQIRMKRGNDDYNWTSWKKIVIE
jgi:hypothetical protein